MYWYIVCKCLPLKNWCTFWQSQMSGESCYTTSLLRWWVVSQQEVSIFFSFLLESNSAFHWNHLAWGTNKRNQIFCNSFEKGPNFCFERALKKKTIYPLIYTIRSSRLLLKIIHREIKLRWDEYIFNIVFISQDKRMSSMNYLFDYRTIVLGTIFGKLYGFVLEKIN